MSAPHAELESSTIAQLQAALASRELSARELSEMCLARIDALDRSGPTLTSVIEVNPDALAIAEALDQERGSEGVARAAARHPGPAQGQHRHRRPDADHGRLAGPGRLAGRAQDATVAARLRAGRRRHPRQDEHERVGQLPLDPLVQRLERARRADAAIPTSSTAPPAAPAPARRPRSPPASPRVASAPRRTARSSAPSAACAVVGIKPTVGLTSRAGVIPIAHSQDTVGPMARTVADAAAVLGALVGADPRDPATAASEGHRARRLHAVPRPRRAAGRAHRRAADVYCGYSRAADAVSEAAIEIMRQHGRRDRRSRRHPDGRGS